MQIDTFTGGIFDTNCFFLPEYGILIDAPQGAASWLADHGHSVKNLLLTHGHIDHVWDAAADRAFDDWASNPCEITGRYNFTECLQIICKKIDIDGEILSALTRIRLCSPVRTPSGLLFKSKRTVFLAFLYS